MSETIEVPPQRINAVEQIEAMMRGLTAYGYDTKALWQEHNKWLAGLSTGTPTDEDFAWAKQAQKPSVIEEHFQQGQSECLSAAGIVKGHSYVLSPGQRDVLREVYGLTPARTVIVVELVMFPNMDIIQSFTLRSGEHVDPRRQRAVLVEAVISPAGAFFRKGHERDKEREEQLDKEDTKRVKKGLVAIRPKLIAAQYFE